MAADEEQCADVLELLIGMDTGPRNPIMFAWRDMFPFNNEETAKSLTKVTDTCVMGLLALTTFSAIYLLYWAKPGSRCVPGLLNGSKVNTPSWQQVLFGVLPFVVFPLTVIVSGMARGAENNRNALSCVASCCICEVVFAIILGGGMVVCIGGTSATTAGISTVFLITLLIIAWALAFNYPRFLRSLVWGKCFRQAAEAPRDRDAILPRAV